MKMKTTANDGENMLFAHMWKMQIFHRPIAMSNRHEI